MGINKTVGRLVAKFMSKDAKGSFKCPVSGCDKKGFESKTEVAAHIFHAHGAEVEQALYDGILNNTVEDEETEDTVIEQTEQAVKQ